VCLARAAGCIVGTCRRTLRPPRSRNYSCTKDYVGNDEDSDDDVDVDVDDAVLVARADKDDAGYDACTSWSPRR